MGKRIKKKRLHFAFHFRCADDHFLRFNFTFWRKSHSHWAQMKWMFRSMCVCVYAYRTHATVWASKRTRENEISPNVYYKHWTIRQFDVDAICCSQLCSVLSGQVDEQMKRFVCFSIWIYECTSIMPNPWSSTWFSCMLLGCVCACTSFQWLEHSELRTNIIWASAEFYVGLQSTCSNAPYTW